MKSPFRFAVFTSIVALVTIGCPPHQEAGKPPATAKKDGGMGGSDWKMSKSGVGFRLSDAEPQVEPPAPPAPASKLSDSDTQKIFARMPALKEEEGDKKTFALREKSLPAPRPGKTVKESFPPSVTNVGPVATAITGALEVVRKVPEGEVSLAPHLSVTFSQPMVPVTSHADLGKRPVPVTLTPTPPGEWIWVGTKTVQFKPKDRFPMSTEYSVEVPAGTKSDSGNALAQAVKWKFTTPTLQVQSATPNHSSVGRSPMIVMTFDQKIKREDLFNFINVTAGSSKVPVHLVDPEEEETKENADEGEDDNDYYGYRYNTPNNFWKGDGKKDRWIAFKPNSELPIDTDIHVKLEKGAPSAEGPRKLPSTYEFSFRTYGPFKLTEAKCGWNDDCEPFT
nr:Ig-like domain-containing protein [Polyangiaceae bacterium]